MQQTDASADLHALLTLTSTLWCNVGIIERAGSSYALCEQCMIVRPTRRLTGTFRSEYDRSACGQSAALARRSAHPAGAL